MQIQGPNYQIGGFLTGVEHYGMTGQLPFGINMNQQNPMMYGQDYGMTGFGNQFPQMGMGDYQGPQMMGGNPMPFSQGNPFEMNQPGMYNPMMMGQGLGQMQGGMTGMLGMGGMPDMGGMLGMDGMPEMGGMPGGFGGMDGMIGGMCGMPGGIGGMPF